MHFASFLAILKFNDQDREIELGEAKLLFNRAEMSNHYPLATAISGHLEHLRHNARSEQEATITIYGVSLAGKNFPISSRKVDIYPTQQKIYLGEAASFKSWIKDLAERYQNSQ